MIAAGHGSALGCIAMLIIVFSVALGPGLISYWRAR